MNTDFNQGAFQLFHVKLKWQKTQRNTVQAESIIFFWKETQSCSRIEWKPNTWKPGPGYDPLDCVFTTKVNEFTNWLLTASASNRQWTHSASIRVSKYGLKRAILSSFSVLYKASDKRYQKLKVTSATWREEESTVQENSKVKKVLLASSLFFRRAGLQRNHKRWLFSQRH